MPAVATECVRDLFAIVLKEQKAKRKSAKLPMVTESFPNANGTRQERMEACKQSLDILNDLKKEEIEGRVNAVIRTLGEAAAARSFLRDVMTVGDYLRYQREKDTELDQLLEQMYENKNRKRLGEIIDLSNLPKVQREDFASGAETLLGRGADIIAHAYGLGGAYSTLKRTVRAFRNRRSHHDVSSLVRMAAITKPKEPKPSSRAPKRI
jgi:hypothetical protein